jgi:very-short-patch-repair endonuclease/prophage antirepressor-like protein
MKNESEIIEFIIESSDEEEKVMTDNELVVYNDNPEKKDYFIGHKIASLMGYANTKQAIQNNVKDENKIYFKDYNGLQEPKLNSNVILITRDGIDDLLSKKKELTSDVIDILSKINVDVSMFAEESEEDEISEEEGELTMYSYINNGYCFEYFVGYEITALLGYKNPIQTLVNVSKQNKLEFRDYPGVKKPKQDPKTILITRDGAIEILIKTRKRISPDVLHILKEFHIETTNRKCLTREQQSLSAITDVFKTENFEDQYKVGKYYLDLYFKDYKIVIECDEEGHADRKPHKERERMDYVNKTLEITDSNWIRYNPDENGFDVLRVIGQIYRKMYDIKFKEISITNGYDEMNEEMKTSMQEKLKKIEEEMKTIEEERKIKMEKEMMERIEEEKKRLEEEMRERLEEEMKKRIEEEKKRIEEEIKEEYSNRLNNDAGSSESKEEEEKWDLEIETTTGKFTPPSKEDLIKKLQKYNVTEIAKKYGISPNPVSKWLKLYDLKVKDFHNYNPPPKEDLILQCRDKSQTEVADHYKTSNHIIRKWLDHYDLDFIKLKSEDKQIGKVELLKLTKEIKDEVELAKKLNITVLNLRKLIKTHNLDNIPSKDELEEHLKTKTKEELALFYNTTRTTLRKWIESYELDTVRISLGKPIKTTTVDNVIKQYKSIVELCLDLNIGKIKVYEHIKSGEFYKGYKYEYV